MPKGIESFLELLGGFEPLNYPTKLVSRGPHDLRFNVLRTDEVGG